MRLGRSRRGSASVVAVALLATCPCAAAPLMLYAPGQQDGGNALSAQTTAPGKACGDLSTPCENLAAPPVPVPPAAFGQGFTFGGSVSTMVGVANHGSGAGLGVTGWLKSPDGDFTVAIAASGFDTRGFGPGQRVGGFGRPH